MRTVVNEISLAGSNTFSRSGASDALLTSKVKATLIDARDVMANAFKVVTERGTVYLMGVVTQREADRATDLARSISGVQKVVRVFEIVSEDELARLRPADPPKPADTKAASSKPERVKPKRTAKARAPVKSRSKPKLKSRAKTKKSKK